MILFLFYPLIFGLIVGSFLNCAIYRLEENKSFLKGRSFCPHCKHNLNWQDLIPIFSFLMLKGKCRYCKKKISLQYPLVEIATALLFLLIFNFEFRILNKILIFNFENILTTFYFLLVFCLLIIIFVYDLKHYIIPDKVLLPAIGITFLYRFFEILEFDNWSFIGNWSLGIGNFKALFNSLSAAFGGGLFFLVIFIIAKGKWLGFGDIKLVFLIGLFLGFPNILVALFLAFLIGAIIGIGLILAKKKTLKSELPFGPFLVGSTIIALFFGQNLIDWYLQFSLL